MLKMKIGMLVKPAIVHTSATTKVDGASVRIARVNTWNIAKTNCWKPVENSSAYLSLGSLGIFVLSVMYCVRTVAGEMNPGICVSEKRPPMA